MLFRFNPELILSLFCFFAVLPDWLSHRPLSSFIVLTAPHWPLVQFLRCPSIRSCRTIVYLSCDMRGTLLSTLQVESIIYLPAYTAIEYMPQVNNENAKKTCEIRSQWTPKTSEQCSFSSVSFSDFEQVNVCWLSVNNNPLFYQKRKLSFLFNLEQQKLNQPVHWNRRDLKLPFPYNKSFPFC